jgi:drug/metabolite transporter (DMT)-like permease
MGVLGALGNYFIIKALSQGELSSIAPINSYKPLVALLLGVLMLNEIPGIFELYGMFFIILGTIILDKSKYLSSKATFYRFLALIFSGTEAIFIKKVILLSDLPSSFLYWALASLIFALIFALTSKQIIKIQKQNVKILLILVLLVTVMQYSTNYVFSKMNVAYALALFQLSTLVSIFLGVNIFNEKGLLKKLIAGLIMLFGASIIILN